MVLLSTVRSCARLLVLGWAGVSAPCATLAGPLNPPVGPVASTAKPLSEIEPRTSINATNTPGDADSLFRITAPGSYYLAGNVTGVSGKSGIEIVASNVTIDLRGFTMQGAAGSLDAIRTNNATTHKVTIRDGIVTGWGTSGINLTQGGPIGASSLIESIHAFGNTGDGIVGGYSAIVRNCIAATNTGRGIVVQDGSLVQSCSVRQSGGDGISTQRGSTLTVCTAQDNTGAGIHVDGGGVVSNCQASGNTLSGILASNTGIATITDCQATNNGLHGIDSRLNGLVSRCSASANTQDGIHIVGGTVSECSAYNNLQNGIRAIINSAYASIILNNMCSGNGSAPGLDAGIYLSGGASRIEGNNCTNNEQGIWVNSRFNSIIRNTCSNNTSNNYNILIDNFVHVIQAHLNATGVLGDSGGNSPMLDGSNPDPTANYSY